MLSVIRSGMAAASQEISVISNNISNASSIGFKKSSASFEDQYTEQSSIRPDQRIGNGAKLTAPRRMHSQGALKETGNALDLGIVGSGMFVLDSRPSQGTLSFTRDGSISVNSDGTLVNADNLPFLDSNSNSITIPFNISVQGAKPQRLTNVSVESDGSIKASYGTTEFLNIGKIGLARFPNETLLKSLGNNNFAETGTSGLAVIGNAKEPGFGTIQAGSLENSNTMITEELILLMRAQQAFNGNAKMLEAEGKVTAKLING
jgi:flagellar hook protein FlgE